MKQLVFDAMKTSVISIPILVFPNTTTLFYIEADNFNYVIEAVFSQKSKTDSKWHLVAFFIKSLFSVKYNYEIYDKKILLSRPLKSSNIS